ncbi:MAG: hypothetical protein AAFO99_06785 [Bacteroidota bacterium]
MKFSPFFIVSMCFCAFLLSCNLKTEQQKAIPQEAIIPEEEDSEIEKTTPKKPIQKPVKSVPDRIRTKKHRTSSDTIRPRMAR